MLQAKIMSHPYGFDDITDIRSLVDLMLARREEVAGPAGRVGGLDMMNAYSDLTDSLIQHILEMAIRDAEEERDQVRRKAARGLAIAAVGGYGRREMAPYSDVDVAFIVGTEEDADIELVTKKAFRILMDVLDAAELKVGYSYRRVDDVDNLPLETQTALLDARCVAGSLTLFNSFNMALRNAITPATFVIDHVSGRTNHSTFRDTPFVVETNIKEGCGGLRDVHAARWIAQVAYNLASDSVWPSLRAKGILLDEEIDEISSAIEFMSRTRNALHLISGRGTDTLTPDKYAAVTEWMQYKNVQEYVRNYYSHAHKIWRIFNKVAQASLLEDLEIEPGIVVRDRRLRILDRGLLTRDSAALMRVFLHAQSYNLEIDRESGDMIYAVAQEYTLSFEGSHVFLDILSQSGAAAALRSMANHGILQAIIPQFSDLMYLIPGDKVHQFTVGEHSLRVVEQLETLLAQDNEQFADIYSRVQHFDVLFVAALMHDVGKLDSRKDHCKTGAVRAKEFAARLGMPQEACAKVEFLVRYHLRMSETARLRDLNHRRTIQNFTAVVNDLQLLDMLLLLTVADYQAVGRTNWSKVQIRFLLELHERAAAALRSPQSMGVDLDRHRSRVRRELCLANLPPDEVEEHCASLPAGYLLNTPPEDLAAHIGYVRTVRGGTPALEIKDERGGEFTQLTVVAMDKPGLLSKIAGVLHALNIDVHAAQIFTRSSSDEIAIDALYIDFEGRLLAEMKKWQLEGELMNVLSDNLSLEELLGRWGKQHIKAPEKLSVDSIENVSDHETVLEIRADDHPGLLYYLTRKISEQGWNIHSARVATWGHEARDVFYVTGVSGGLLGETEIAQFEERLRL